MVKIYNSYDEAYKKPFGAVKNSEEITFCLNFDKSMPTSKACLKIFPMDNESEFELVQMELIKTSRTKNVFSCKYTPEKIGLYGYYFEIETEDVINKVLKGANNASVIGEGNWWQLTVYSKEMQTPKTLLGGIMYQVFPDRFYNSKSPKNYVGTDRTVRDDWGAIPEWKPNEKGEITNSDYFCGDLKGIIEKLDYIEELGTTVIYLNPIFEAHSSHRYNTADYNKIDPFLGTEEDFKELCEQAKKRGISIILDGVFSHTGSDSLYFNKNKRYGEGGAFNDPQSPYFPWYKFINYPDKYESWWGMDTLPNVHETNEDYLNFICGSEGVLVKWMKLGAAGYRLDVADELPDKFLDRLYKCVKEENPEASVIGEVWEDASNKISYGFRRRYLLGQQMDSVMNYNFKGAILGYIRYGNGKEFLGTIMQILENYPKPVIPVLMNSLSTHDTPRAITMLVGDTMVDNDRKWQAEHHYLSQEQYQKGRILFLLSSIIQFGLPGIPCVYYGDEAGLSGYRDPFNRVCYPWGYEDNDLIESIKQLGQIKKKYKKLADAEFTPVIFSNSVCAFVRRTDEGLFLFAVNRSTKEYRLPDFEFKTQEILFSNNDFENLTLKPLSGIVVLYKI